MNLWIKNLLAQICHFNTQKYNNLFGQAGSSMPNNLTKEFNFQSQI